MERFEGQGSRVEAGARGQRCQPDQVRMPAAEAAWFLVLNGATKVAPFQSRPFQAL